MKISIPSHLSNDELVAGLERFASAERRDTAQVVAHLVALETRGLHLKAGFNSLFAYCCEALRLSEDAAYNRIEAARAARRFPVILDMLDAGDLSITTARLLGKVLTPDNHSEVLAAASGQSKRAVEELIVQYAPQPDGPMSLRKVPERTSAGTATTRVAATVLPAVPMASAPAPAPPPSRPASVTPLAPSRYELKVTVTKETRDKQSRAVSPDAREPAAEVRRAVSERDGHRCTYVAPSGRRCNARAFLEFQHVKMYVNGGQATVDNISLRCRNHNQYEADAFFEGIVRESRTPYKLSIDHSTRSGTGNVRMSPESGL